MKEKLLLILCAALIITASAACTVSENGERFVMNKSFTSETEGTCHYNIFVPEEYDGSVPFALHIALPGWEGLYFQGVGEDLKWEYMPYESINYISDMIIVSAQLNDWGRTSARQAVALTEYIMSQYNIDPNRVYITGYSGGGETLSLVMELKPELYAAAVFVSSQWDGDPSLLVNARTPLYMFTAENDSYYGSEPVRGTYDRMRALYEQAGLSGEEIDGLLRMEIRTDEEMDALSALNGPRTGRPSAVDYHGAGTLSALDENVMNWVFGKTKAE